MRAHLGFSILIALSLLASCAQAGLFQKKEASEEKIPTPTEKKNKPFTGKNADSKDQKEPIPASKLSIKEEKQDAKSVSRKTEESKEGTTAENLPKKSQAQKGSNAVKVGKNSSVRAAYDDGLEETPEDEESSARPQGLQDTVVRTTVVRAAQIIADASRKGWNVLQSLTGSKNNNNEGKIISELTEMVETKKGSSAGKGSPKQPAEDKTELSGDTAMEIESQKPAKASDTTSSNSIATSLMDAGDSPKSVKVPSAESPANGDLVKIGQDSFERQYVQAVGDIDGNGVTDFVVRSPLENYSTGAIRVYMMAKGGAIKSSRHLVPGKWGFNPKSVVLKKGDRFGTSVFKVGDVNGDGINDLAVTAPGENQEKNGSMFVLIMADDGSVLDSHVVNRFAAGLGDEPCDGEERSVVQIKERIMRLVQTKDVTDKVKVPSSSKAAVGDCYFSDTQCQCLKLPSSSLCYDFVETNLEGKLVCTERNCEASYKCSCDDKAKEFCDRSTGMREVYAKVGPLSDGKVECKKEQSANEVANVIVGATVPTQKPIGSSGTSQSGVWSETECACTPKDALSDPGQCPQFDHTKGDAKFCLPRACKISQEDMACDLDGKSICSRKKIQKAIFVDDGPANDPSFIKCHEETVEREVVECTSNCP